MSSRKDDDLEKLAAEMKHIRPSKSARAAGMENAMAAFSAEFSAKSVSSAENEKISAAVQGSSTEPRPKSQSTDMSSVRIFGSELMSTVNNFFTVKPANRWMMGSCAAALIAALVILPQTQDITVPGTPNEKFSSISGEVSQAGEPAPLTEAVADEEITVTGTRVPGDALESPAPVKVDTGASSDGKKDDSFAGTAQIGSIADLLDKVRSQDTGDARREADFRDRSQSQNNQLTAPTAPQIERKVASGYVDNRTAQPVTTGNAPTAQQNTTTFNFTNQQQTVSPNLSDAGSRTTRVAGGLTLEEVPAEYETKTKTIVTKEATTELVKTPPTFETVTETVVTQEARTEQVVVPPKYEWVDGEIEGMTTEYVAEPAEYETIQDTVVVQEASTELISLPAVYNEDGTIAQPARTVERVVPSVIKTETRRVVKSPARTIERQTPYEIKDGRTRVPVQPSAVIERTVPAVTKEVSRRVIKTPASTVERVIPAGTEMEVQVRTKVTPERFYLRDEAGNIVREFESRDQFESYMSNPVTIVKEKPVSTFSVDVDTASYSFLRASVNAGRLPPPSSVRIEEMINYFPYDYEAPKSADEPFKANVTVTPTPWNADTKLMHIGIKGFVPPADDRPSSNIVFLIDTSGSMNQPNKLPLLINSFKLLLKKLDEDDTVSIVTYAGSAGTVLEPTPASNKSEINAALNRLRAGGSTAGAAGLELAYMKAQESFDKDSVNRVILATDGDFNVGFSSPDEMKDFIEKKRKSGIFLSVLGFGMGNYNDHLMQALAQNGNGVAAYIDSLSEANKVLADEAGSALFTIAKDVKIQVEFNPATISEYRLIGYETRALKREDFNNDKVDAGEINAGHTVTAIYELTPVGSPAQMVDNLRYASSDDDINGSDEYAFVKIRHKLPDADTSTLQTFPIGERQERSLRRASDDMRFATAVAAVAQKLRGVSYLEDFSYDDAIKLATDAKGNDERGYRAEFIEMVRLIDAIDE